MDPFYEEKMMEEIPKEDVQSSSNEGEGKMTETNSREEKATTMSLISKINIFLVLYLSYFNNTC